MERGRALVSILVLSILSNAFSSPLDLWRVRRPYGNDLEPQYPYYFFRGPVSRNMYIPQYANVRMTRQNEEINTIPPGPQNEAETTTTLASTTVSIPTSTITPGPSTDHDISKAITNSPETTPPQNIPITLPNNPISNTPEPKTNKYKENSTQSTVTHATPTTAEPKPIQSKEEIMKEIFTPPTTAREPLTNLRALNSTPINPAVTLPPKPSDYELQKEHYQTAEPSIDDLEHEDEEISSSSSSNGGGGSNILSLLNLFSASFPGSSGANNYQVHGDKPYSPLWNLKVDIARALIQFGVRMVAKASSFVASASTTVNY